ncbi:MAG TPA: ABC transporter permease [candidate division Zixibacteria bacterium]|nr:ABC transporter permease [candidate division Zixibacteria bacterium]
MAVNSILRTIKQAIWVGWKVETNWADPLVFAIYYLIRPLSSLLIVGFVFLVGRAVGSNFTPEYFAFMFIGNSFFIYVTQIMMTMSMLIHDDRSHYEVLKHIYLAPSSLSWYIIGRSLNGVLNASISLAMTLGFGVLIFQDLLGVQIPINWSAVNFPLLALTLGLGVVCFIGMGFVLCGVNIMTSRVQFMLSEYVSGILYLFGGVVFLPSVLPLWGQAVSRALPITYFLGCVRSSFLQQTSATVQTDLLYLIVTMIGTIIVGYLIFKFAMYRARKEGLIDRKEEY